ncbi:MAG: hypothetical protein L6Q26_11985 [Anaerolineales bacterium]|nr:hypothetical protein [Anaerolineales bacterium]NUQ83882.1 hypothetical protein [Anaerolineales bacterium]
MNTTHIVIDGRVYNSVEEMPPEVRAKYEQAISAFKDENRDGAPDVFESPSSSQVVTNVTKFVVDGVEYDRLEDLPPEARARYEKTMGMLDKDRNGIPDFVEGFMNATEQTPPPASAYGTAAPRQSTFSNPQRKPISPTPALAPDTSNGWMLALAGIFLLLLCIVGAAGVWYFFLNR